MWAPPGSHRTTGTSKDNLPPIHVQHLEFVWKHFMDKASGNTEFYCSMIWLESDHLPTINSTILFAGAKPHGKGFSFTEPLNGSGDNSSARAKPTTSQGGWLKIQQDAEKHPGVQWCFCYEFIWVCSSPSLGQRQDAVGTRPWGSGSYLEVTSFGSVVVGLLQFHQDLQQRQELVPTIFILSFKFCVRPKKQNSVYESKIR